MGGDSSRVSSCALLYPEGAMPAELGKPKASSPNNTTLFDPNFQLTKWAAQLLSVQREEEELDCEAA